MDWSAALALKTSRSKQYLPNYGSFASSSDRANGEVSQLKRTGSGIRIPQSIPENQCVNQFTSPRKDVLASQVAAYYKQCSVKDEENPASEEHEEYDTRSMSSTTQRSSKIQRMLLLRNAEPTTNTAIKKQATATATTPLLSSSSIDVWNDTKAQTTSSSPSAARAAGDEQQPLDNVSGSNYWMQERERLRAKHERRRLLRAFPGFSRRNHTQRAVGTASSDILATTNGHEQAHTKTAHGSESPVMFTQPKTAMIMCSVPLLLVLVFVILVYCFPSTFAVTQLLNKGATANAAMQMNESPRVALRRNTGVPMLASSSFFLQPWHH